MRPEQLAFGFTAVGEDIPADEPNLSLEQIVLQEWENIRAITKWLFSTQDRETILSLQKKFKELYPRLCFHLAKLEMERAPIEWDKKLPFVKWLL